MTLGGLALAVGILVDDATVEIENTHRNLGMGKPLVRAVLDGASQIAVPTFVSTLSICIVFVPVLLLTGHGAVSVHAAGDGGGVRDDGVLPAVANAGADDGASPAAKRGRRCTRPAGTAATGCSGALHRGVNRLFERLRYRYLGLLDLSLAHRGAGAARRSWRCRSDRCCWCALVGRDFFPDVDAGTLRLHARTPPGTRIEQTELRFADVEQEIRDALPAGRDRHDSRQHRHPERLEQPRAGRRAEHRGHRRRDPDFAQSRAPRAGAATTKSSCASG